MELKRRKLQIKLDGESYEMSFPTVKQMADYKTDLDSQDDDSQTIEVMANFFDSLGLPKEVCYSLELDHLSQISEELAGSKKK